MLVVFSNLCVCVCVCACVLFSPAGVCVFRGVCSRVFSIAIETTKVQISVDASATADVYAFVARKPISNAVK